ncbi:hypothetical protein NXW78_21345 [Bacteroides ovatus]|nr:hypothetical protein [Bacteroides ovatus]
MSACSLLRLWGVLTACSDNDAENPEGGKPGGEDVNPAPEVVEFVNSNLGVLGR